MNNTASLDYDVNSVAQTTIDDNEAFVVDRLLDLNVTRQSLESIDIDVSDSGSLIFEVTNESNDDVDIQFSRVSQTGNADAGRPTGGTLATEGASPGGDYTLTVCVDVSSATSTDTCEDEAGTTAELTAAGGIYTIDASDTNYTFDPGTAVTIIVEVTANSNVTGGAYDNFVFAAAVTDGVGGTRVTRDSNDQISPDGTATGSEDSDSLGVDQTTLAVTEVQNVFGDAAVGDEVNFGTLADTGSDDTERNGQVAAVAQFIINAPVMTITKQSLVVFDPIVGAGQGIDEASPAGGGDHPTVSGAVAPGIEPKRIPGAVIQYEILIENDNTGGFSTTADDVTITDSLPSELAFGLANTINFCDGNATGLFPSGAPAGATCTTDLSTADWEVVLVEPLRSVG